MKGSKRGIGLLLAAGLVAGAPLATAQAFSTAEARGRQIFHDGTRAAGVPLTARIGMMSQQVRASVVPCAGCHGEDGRGTEEGGILRPDITWQHLVRPGGHQHDSGRTHPAFTADSFAAAVRRGIDPAGNRLDPTMPRYELAGPDIDDLVAYLRRLSRAGPPGDAEPAPGTSLRSPALHPGDAAAKE